MPDVSNVVQTLLGRDPNAKEIEWFTAIDRKMEEFGESSAFHLPNLLPHDDLLSIAIKLGVAPDYIEKVEHIDVSPNNDCPDRSGVCSVRLLPGYVYYDHRIAESSANPHPGTYNVSVLPTGVDVHWRVPFIGSYAPWGCGGARSWLDAYVTVRGTKSS